ncbi:MAG: hypothetical protein JWL77_7147 [Chthonomonadaceae bacterium]|nr:hypothetical protein [Chthonomonadaceae bacterium]
MIGSDTANHLWLPASALVAQPIAEIPKGALVLGRPHGRDRPAAWGIRFDLDDYRFVYAISDDGEGRRSTGKAQDVTDRGERAYRVDLNFAVEADLSRPVSGWGIDDPRAGQLVAGADGAALVARFHQPGEHPRLDPVSLKTWMPTERDVLDTVFGAWRLRIDVPGVDPIYLDPRSLVTPPSS